MDRLGDRPAGAQFRGLPECGSGHGQAAAGITALWSGTYKGTRMQFHHAMCGLGMHCCSMLLQASLNAQVVVRTVKVSYRASYPDLVEYAITFANDWADDLAIKTSATVPEDTWLPVKTAPLLLAKLTGLTVTALSGSTVKSTPV